jgi:hypothetical protein
LDIKPNGGQAADQTLRGSLAVQFLQESSVIRALEHDAILRCA